MNVKIYFSSGPPISISEEAFRKAMASDKKLVPITDEKGKWSGLGLNKAHIVSFRPDFESPAMKRLKPGDDPQIPKAERQRKLNKIKKELSEKYGFFVEKQPEKNNQKENQHA